MMKLFLTVLFCVSSVAAETEEELDAYYGVPLGTLHHSADRTKAEMYAADEYTVIFNHFSHSPSTPGCTSIIVGPPRSTDKHTVGTTGVLIPITQPLLTPRSRARRARSKRTTPFSFFHGFNWPAEFAHLRMDPKTDVHHQNYEPEDAFAGIELHVGSSVDEPVVKDVNIDDVPVEESANIKHNPNDRPQSQKMIEEIGEHPTAKTAKTVSADKIYPTTLTSAMSTSTAPTTVAKSSRIPKAKSAYPQSDQPSTGRKPKVHKTTPATPYSASAHQATKAIIFFDTKTQSDMGKSREKIETAGPGIVVFNSDRITPRPTKVHPSFYGPLARTKEAEPTTTVAPTKSPITRDVITDDTYIAYFGGGPRTESTTDWPRRAPSRKNYEDRTNDEVVVGKNSHERKSWSTSTAASPVLTGSTPLFYVIEDLREERRRLRAERHKKNKQQEPAKQHAFATYTLEPTVTTEASTTTTTQLPPKRLDRQYELPVVQDKTIAFTLTNGAKLTDYDWIGLYNLCDQKATPLISLKGIDPPREEKIGPFTGWKHNISSESVQILNCNTILIPGFVYNATLAPKGTFVYVGIGQFPDAIEKQVKATIVGQQGNGLTRNYGLEDIMIRLPQNYRTFDIDFISIYNEVEQKGYAYVAVPSLLVPPCSEEV